jgi:hypothetical protein
VCGQQEPLWPAMVGPASTHFFHLPLLSPAYIGTPNTMVELKALPGSPGALHSFKSLGLSGLTMYKIPFLLHEGPTLPPKLTSSPPSLTSFPLPPSPLVWLNCSPSPWHPWVASFCHSGNTGTNTLQQQKHLTHSLCVFRDLCHIAIFS